jgi:hypothetical protein
MPHEIAASQRRGAGTARVNHTTRSRGDRSRPRSIAHLGMTDERVTVLAYSHYETFGEHIADIFGRAVIYGAVGHFMRHMSGPEIVALVLLVLGGWWLVSRRS